MSEGDYACNILGCDPDLPKICPLGHSWVITKLLGPQKWTYYYLYVILDIFSRYIVGWMVASVESAQLAKRLIAGTCASQRVERDTLTIHADRGSSMASKPVAFLLADLGVTKSASRPHVSNDNPFSENQFKTFKYRPSVPGRFGSIEDARAHRQPFFRWYTFEHRHAGIALLTPADVHHRRAAAVIAARAHVLMNAYAANPERFVRVGKPPAPVGPSCPSRGGSTNPTRTRKPLSSFRRKVPHRVDMFRCAAWAPGLRASKGYMSVRPWSPIAPLTTDKGS